MKKLIIALALFAVVAGAEVYQTPAPIDVTITVTGFDVKQLTKLDDESWKIIADLTLTNHLTDEETVTNGVNVQITKRASVAARPIRIDVSVTQIEIATFVGIDVTQEGWEAIYMTKPYGDLRTAVITVAQTKVISLVL